ncbi:LytR/AlgR family response regulator transcription factor [Belliella kenyensis]|uniref:LytR/AlgR family response regulator transcription factor n=1 Tax=Belliella kenyensis TaxID=1472724 RepID=A0ABV8EN67_9BACT|nr:response regulator transcription factor [Belliella kenyensis]MCH7400534.1 response regulator transcription factor [Belliella kenyensis]MDN3604450.1 response regulator transcription factor [Belliella kenyensis]
MKKILIVEDEFELAENLKDILQVIGYEVSAIISNGRDVLLNLEIEQPDLIIMDILIIGNLDGIDLAYKIKDTYEIPIVFLTGYTDKAFLDRISNILYEGYLLKPFTLDRLRSSLYLAFKEFDKKKQSNTKHLTLKIWDKGFLVPVPTNEITHLEADGLYTKVHTLTKPYTVRDILKDVATQLPSDKFIRIHKSFIVNTDHIVGFNSKELNVGLKIIPIRRGFYKELKKIIISE